MNKLVTQILHLGIIFGIAAIFLEFFLMRLAPLDWIALGGSFLFVAALILDSLTRLIPKEESKHAPAHQGEDEFQHLETLIERALYRGEHEAVYILGQRLRSMALGAVAARARLSKRELDTLAEKDPEALKSVVKDEHLIRLLAEDGQTAKAVSRREVQELLSKIEALFQ